MLCEQCGAENDDAANLCQKCGHAISSGADSHSGVITETSPRYESSGIVALIVRSAILGAISSPVYDVPEEQYWIAVAAKAVIGIVIALFLYGIEKGLFRLLRRSPDLNPMTAAAYRGALLLFIMSFLMFSDFWSSLGTATSGALFGALLYVIERALKRSARKRRAS